MLINSHRKSANLSQGPLSLPRFEQVDQRSRSFTGVAAFTSEVFNLTGRRRSGADSLGARRAGSSSRCSAFRPVLGRSFRAEEDKAGGDPVVMISDALWQRRFARDRAVIGRTMTLDARDYTIIGVLPPDFRFGLPRADDRHLRAARLRNEFAHAREWRKRASAS